MKDLTLELYLYGATSNVMGKFMYWLRPKFVVAVGHTSLDLTYTKSKSMLMLSDNLLGVYLKHDTNLKYKQAKEFMAMVKSLWPKHGYRGIDDGYTAINSWLLVYNSKFKGCPYTSVHLHLDKEYTFFSLAYRGGTCIGLYEECGVSNIAIKYIADDKPEYKTIYRRYGHISQRLLLRLDYLLSSVEFDNDKKLEDTVIYMLEAFEYLNMLNAKE